MEDDFIDIEIKSEKEFLDSINKNLEKINSNKSNIFSEKTFTNNLENFEQILSKNNILNNNLNENDNKNSVINKILIGLNKNSEIEIPENQECKEILQILRKPYSEKNIRKNIIFKSLSKPRKISLFGRVLSDIPIDNENTNTKKSNSNTYNDLIFESH